jgi:murein DD-endopeptidase MepM/ murein hydrolase activator NlpD
LPIFKNTGRQVVKQAKMASPRGACWSWLGLALILLAVIAVAGALVGYSFYRSHVFSPLRFERLMAWLRNSAEHANWTMRAGEICNDAPFQMPTDGYIGFLWGDSFRIGHHHQGIDIFGGGDAGVTPVYAAYPGYLTRQPDWKSTVIIRVPEDPLQPGRQIWTYYTHMANPDGESYIAPQFPPGTFEQFVEAGTLLGYQGNYSGTPNNPVGVHLHFSIVQDDGQGSYLNELEIGNTLDPSLYLGLPLNAGENPDQIPVCLPQGSSVE